MGRSTLVLVAFAYVTLAMRKSVVGLECFQCDYAYANGAQVPGSDDPSCASGNEPKAKYAVDCEEELRMGVGVGVAFNKSMTTPDPEMSARGKTHWGCVKISGEGLISGGDKVKWTTRGCLKSTTKLKENCKTMSLSDWNEQEREIYSKMVSTSAGAEMLASGNQISYCYCKGNLCNPASSVIPTLPMKVLMGTVGVFKLAFVKNII